MGKRNGLLDSAIIYADTYGLSILPCAPREKYPISAHGSTDATADIETIRSWWQKTPNANIGIATGLKHGIIVIDLDEDKERGISGKNSLRELEKEYGKLPDTWIADTPSGGMHYYFKCPAGIDIKNSVCSIGEKIDIRGDGGYVICPPSIHPNGGRYIWDYRPGEYPLAELPLQWVEYIQSKANKPSSPADAAAAEYAPYKLPDIIPQGTRDNEAFKFACSLVAKKCTKDEVFAALTAVQSRFKPPLTAQEIQAKVESAMRYKDTPFAQIPAEEPVEVFLNADVFTTMDTVAPKERTWLIPQRIARGEMTIFAADGGSGKSSITLDVIHGVITGQPCFLDYNTEYQKRPVGDVLLLSCEDAMDYDILPQLMAMGTTPADLKRVHIVDATKLQPEQRDHMVLGDAQFERAIKSLHEKSPLSLIVIDPLQSYLSADVNMVSRNAMRKALDGITDMARILNIAIIILCHTNKKGNVSGRGRVSDSTDIWDHARTLYMAGETKTKGDFYFSIEKGNHINRTVTPTILYRFESAYAYTDAGTRLETKRIIPCGVTDKRDADFMYERMGSRKVEKVTLVDTCEVDLLKILYDQPVSDDGSRRIKTNELENQLKEHFSDSTIRNAKDSLKKQKKIRFESKGFKPKVHYVVLLPNLDDENPYDSKEYSPIVPME